MPGFSTVIVKLSRIVVGSTSRETKEVSFFPVLNIMVFLLYFPRDTAKDVGFLQLKADETTMHWFWQ